MRCYWDDYKVFKQNCHYTLYGKTVDYWDLSTEEQEDAEIICDDAVLVEEFSERTDSTAYKYFKGKYGGDEEHPSYYVLKKADGGYFEHGDTTRIFSDLDYSGF